MGNLHADLMAFHPEVTGSSILVSVRYPNGKRTKFGVDFGMFQEEKYTSLNKKIPFNPEELAFMLVTHSHIDHTGRLPFLVKKGFNKKIYLTKGTNLLIMPALKDSYKILREREKLFGKKEKAIYNYDDVRRTKELLEPVDFERSIQVDELDLGQVFRHIFPRIYIFFSSFA